MESSDSFSSMEHVSSRDFDSSIVTDGTSSESNEDQSSISKGGVTTPFPWKLHIMLDHMEAQGDEDTVAWCPHGRAFTVRKPKEFVATVMPQFFNQTKYASFQRQLNLYGFSRLTHGPDKGAYYHSCFLRGEQHLCKRMIRQKIKGTKVRKSLSPEEEPNFYNMTGQLPKIPSEEEIAQYQKNKKRAKKNAAATPQVTPVTTKPVKRVSASRRRSSASVAYPAPAPPPPQQQPLTQPNSYVILPHPSQPLTASTRTVSPHSSSVALADSHQLLHQMPLLPMPNTAGITTLQPPAAARGGDLLFFEGQPFRYLEHIEEIPPTPTQVVAMSQPPPLTTTAAASLPPRRSPSLQDMITTIRDSTEPIQHAAPRHVFSV